MKLEDATAFAEKCFTGEPAPCSRACPFRLDIRGFMEKAEKKRWNAAYKALRNAVVFPVIVSALCPAPCGGVCLRSQTGDEPIALNLMEDACIKYAKNRKPDAFVIPPKTETIAVVGAGVAGLAAALCLAQKKYRVTVFDKNEGWGGSIRNHPRFEDFYADIELQFSAAEAEFKFNTEIRSLDELSGFDLIYIATGKDGADFGLLSGWENKLLTTAEPKVFIGGALTGASITESIVQGIRLSKTAEYYLQTGKAQEAISTDTGVCGTLDYSDATSVPRTEPSEDGGYTVDEAVTEAARCFKCDCDKCLASCEMLSAFRKKPKKIAMEVYTDTKVIPPYSTHTLTRQAYSCNMCGHCKSVCPGEVDIGGLLQTSRTARIEDGVYPAAIHDYWLREMDFYSGEAFFYATPEDNCEYLFFPGCQLGAHNPQHVFKSFEFLSEKYNAGIFTACCGAPAYWAGDIKRQEANFERIREVWRELGEPKFIFACATCESLFEKFLPEISRVSLYELLAQSDVINPQIIYKNAAVFDPCNARKNPEIETAVRKLAKKSGAELSEMSEKNRCCGYGGHMRLGNPELYDKITENRAAMSELPYIVYCANCKEVFQSRDKACAHILDIVFGLPHGDKIPCLESRQKNPIMIKYELMKKIKGVEIEIKRNEWDHVPLAFSAELRDSFDKKLISMMDVREAIWRAETTGDYFYDESEDVYRCCMERAVLTYWVTYKKRVDGGFELLEAYCHRMRFSREEA